MVCETSARGQSCSLNHTSSRHHFFHWGVSRSPSARCRYSVAAGTKRHSVAGDAHDPLSAQGPDERFHHLAVSARSDGHSPFARKVCKWPFCGRYERFNSVKKLRDARILSKPVQFVPAGRKQRCTFHRPPGGFWGYRRSTKSLRPGHPQETLYGLNWPWFQTDPRGVEAPVESERVCSKVSFQTDPRGVEAHRPPMSAM
jgi:hypothetical protein